VGAAPAPISGSGALTFRIPLDRDSTAAVNMSAAFQIFPKAGPGRSFLFQPSCLLFLFCPRLHHSS